MEINLVYIIPSIAIALLCVISSVIYHLYSRFNYNGYTYRTEVCHKEFVRLQEALASLGVSAQEAQDNLTALAAAIQEKEQQNTALNEEVAVRQIKINFLSERSDELSRTIGEKEQTLVEQERIVRERLQLETAQYAENLEQEQQQTMNEFLDDWNKMISETTAQKILVEQELEQARKNAQAAVEQAKLALAEQQEKDFYRLQLSDEAVQDISHLREVESYLHQPEALNKVIWKVYYEKAYTDLIGRVFGKRTPCGIYKITNIDTQMSYIGQAVNVPERWKQHIKRGCGADTPTQNKLYPAMKKAGPERFMFQLLEECSRDKLDAQEDYWQEFYKVKEFGYSIK